MIIDALYRSTNEWHTLEFTQKTFLSKEPLKLSSIPDSEATSRSSRSSDDIVNVDSCFRGLLVMWAGVMHSEETEKRNQAPASVSWRFLCQGKDWAHQDWREILNCHQCSHCHCILFSLKKVARSRLNKGGYVNKHVIRVLACGVLTAIAGASIGTVISQRLVQGPRWVAGFPFIP